MRYGSTLISVWMEFYSVFEKRFPANGENDFSNRSSFDTGGYGYAALARWLRHWKLGRRLLVR